jgi:hypothetical protein
MKNLILKFTFLLLLVAASNVNAQQQKKIFWVHGLSGSEQAWKAYFNRPAFNNLPGATKSVKSFSFKYDETGNLAGAAASLKNGLFNAQTNSDPSTLKTQHLAIAHSQGGLVTRRYIKDNASDLRIGGFITVGTPNKDAFILNSLKNGAVNNYVNSLCTEMTAGPASDAGGIILPVIGPFLGGAAANAVCSFISPRITNHFSGEFFQNTANDFEFGDNINQTLGVSNLPKIGIQGIEDAPVHWRTITSYTLNSPANLGADVTQDGTIGNIMSIVRGIYAARRITLFVPPFPGRLFRASQYKRGMDWLDSSEQGWKNLVTPPGWNQAGDGVVPQQSQILDGASENLVAQGANHAELRNHPSVTSIFMPRLKSQMFSPTHPFNCNPQ